MVDTSGSVEVQTLNDVKAFLRAYFRGDLGEPPNRENRSVSEYRQSLMVSGTALIFAGEKYEEGVRWTESW